MNFTFHKVKELRNVYSKEKKGTFNLVKLRVEKFRVGFSFPTTSFSEKVIYCDANSPV